MGAIVMNDEMKTVREVGVCRLMIGNYKVLGELA